MRLIARMAISLVLVAALGGSVSARSSSRVEKAEYVGGGYLQAGPASIHSICNRVTERRIGGACFAPKTGERSVRVTVEDEAGVDVAAVLVRRGMRDVEFCGSTNGRVRIPEGKQFDVVLRYAECGGAMPTLGVIAVKFFRQ
jgi:hypothetical protein